MPEEQVAAAVAESGASTEAAVVEAEQMDLPAVAQNLADMQVLVETLAARIEVVEAATNGEVVEAGEHETEEERKKKELEAQETETEEEKREKDEEMSEVKVAVSRAKSAESKLKGVTNRERNREIKAFSEKVSIDYGVKRHKDIMKVVERKLAAIPVLDSFDESGASALVAVFDEVLAIAGPATISRIPGAAGRVNVRGKEGLTDKAIEEEIFSELPDGEAKTLRGRPDTLKVMVDKRRKEMEE